MAHAKPFEDALYEEIIARLKQDDSSVPYRKNGLLVPHPLRARQGTSDICAAQDSLDAPEEILLDANALAPGTTTTGSARSKSRRMGSGSRSARTPSAGANTPCASRICRRGEILAVAIADVESDLAWANDNRTCCTSKRIPRRCSAYTSRSTCSGEDPQHDALVFEQTDKSFYTGVSKSKSDASFSSAWRARCPRSGATREAG